MALGYFLKIGQSLTSPLSPNILPSALSLGLPKSSRELGKRKLSGRRGNWEPALLLLSIFFLTKQPGGVRTPIALHRGSFIFNMAVKAAEFGRF